MSRLWKPVRNVIIDGTSYEAYDMDITVSMPDSDPFNFDITLFNIGPDNWDSIAQEDDVVVELGWESETVEPVIFGEIDYRDTEFSGQDMAYQVWGDDKSDKALQAVVSDSFRGRTTRCDCNRVGVDGWAWCGYGFGRRTD